MFKRAVDAFEVLALAAALTFVVLLFAYRPSKPTAAGAKTASPVQALGARVYATNCASCPGAGGEGLVGPKLGGGAVVKRYASAADEKAFVLHGAGAMPAWQGRLSNEEIDAVVAYTRTGLGR